MLQFPFYLIYIFLTQQKCIFLLLGRDQHTDIEWEKVQPRMRADVCEGDEVDEEHWGPARLLPDGQQWDEEECYWTYQGGHQQQCQGGR